MAADDAIVSLNGVRRAYGPKVAVDGTSLTLRRGRILGLLGASGSGKSTLLRLIAGLEPVDDGDIRIDGSTVSAPGRTVAPELRRVGIVFQDFALFPHLTVAGNVGFGLRGRATAARRATVQALLERVRLADRAGSWPHALSGGEQQRVALARALARDPAVILLDEPFSSLDGPLRVEVRDDLTRTLRDHEASAIVVTHDAEDAMVMADDLILMDAGRVIQSGSPRDCYRRPASIAAARLLGPVDLVPAQVCDGVATSSLGRVETALADGPAAMGIRPTDLALGATGPLQGRVVAVGFAGAFSIVTVQVGTSTLAVHVGTRPPNVGDRVGVRPDPSRIMALPLQA